MCRGGLRSPAFIFQIEVLAVSPGVSWPSSRCTWFVSCSAQPLPDPKFEQLPRCDTGTLSLCVSRGFCPPIFHPPSTRSVCVCCHILHFLTAPISSLLQFPYFSIWNTGTSPPRPRARRFCPGPSPPCCSRAGSRAWLEDLPFRRLLPPVLSIAARPLTRAGERRMELLYPRNAVRELLKRGARASRVGESSLALSLFGAYPL